MPNQIRNPKSELRTPKGFRISEFGLRSRDRRQKPRARRLVRALLLERLEDRTLL